MSVKLTDAQWQKILPVLKSITGVSNNPNKMENYSKMVFPAEDPLDDRKNRLVFYDVVLELVERENSNENELEKFLVNLKQGFLI